MPLKVEKSETVSKRIMPMQEKRRRTRKKSTRKEKISEIILATVRIRGPTRRLFFRGLGEIEKENLASTSSDTNSSLTN